MAADNRWIQDALDAWLSDEPGTGPPGDEGWRERTGYSATAWHDGDGAPAAAVSSSATPAGDAPPATPTSATPAGGSVAAGKAAVAAGYEEQRMKLRTAMAGFTERLRYTFPNAPAMTVTDLAAAGGLVADMERQLLVAGGWAVLHKADGRPELRQEVDAALAELGHYKQAYRLQRDRIEQAEAGRIAEINRDTAVFIREQDGKRREIVEKADEDIRRMREVTDRKRREDDDRRQREAVAAIRGEDVFRITIEREP
jgi:hypothetical protein